MKLKETRDFLIRKMPIEIYNLIEKAAKKHNRNKTQEALVALKMRSLFSRHTLQQLTPLKWQKRISSAFIKNALI